jgi:hypothetical protein
VSRESIFSSVKMVAALTVLEDLLEEVAMVFKCSKGLVKNEVDCVLTPDGCRNLLWRIRVKIVGNMVQCRNFVKGWGSDLRRR